VGLSIVNCPAVVAFWARTGIAQKVSNANASTGVAPALLHRVLFRLRSILRLAKVMAIS